MKKLLLLSLILFALDTYAQIGINATNVPPAASAMLDVASTTKGILIPRMTTTQRNALTATATDGLTVYDVTTKSFWFYNGNTADWTVLATGNNWLNNGTNIYNGNTGNVGIGTSSPEHELDVRGTLFLRSSHGSLRIGYPNSNQWRFSTMNGGQDLQLHSSTNGVDFVNRLYFDGNNGNVGIGLLESTGLPTAKLHVVGMGNSSGNDSGTDPILKLKITNDFNFGWERFENADGTKSFSHRYDFFSGAASNSYRLYYGTDNLFSVTGTGRFGLNVSAPEDLLHLRPLTITGDVYARISSTTGLAGLRLQNNLGDWSVYTNEFSKLFIGYSPDNYVTNNQVIIAEPNGADYNFMPSTTNQVNLGTDTNRWKTVQANSLDVSGNANVTGEVNRTQTGTSNMVPIAYGTITAAGVVVLGTSSGNVTCTKVTTGLYDIGITGENYHFQMYTALATAIDSSSPKIITTGSGGGLLHVYTFNTAGVATDTGFGFVVYKK
jgi:hypothetical protein